MSDEKVVVVFKQSWRGYSKGEKAGFDEAQAKALVDGKVADLAKGGKAAAKPAASPAGKDGGKGASGKSSGGDVSLSPGAGDETPPGPATPPADEKSGDDDEPKP